MLSLDTLYAHLNKRLFGGRLPANVPVDISNSLRGSDADAELHSVFSASGNRYKIALNPGIHHGGVKRKTAKSVVHEMVHIYLYESGASKTENKAHGKCFINSMRDVGVIYTRPGEKEHIFPGGPMDIACAELGLVKKHGGERYDRQDEFDERAHYSPRRSGHPNYVNDGYGYQSGTSDAYLGGEVNRVISKTALAQGPVVVCFDKSGSMRRLIGNALHELDRYKNGVVIIQFDEVAFVSSSDVALSEPAGGTDLSCALVLARKYRPSRIVMVSDGDDHCKRKTLFEAEALHMDTGVPIDTIWVAEGSYYDTADDIRRYRQHMINIAKAGGGVFTKAARDPVAVSEAVRATVANAPQPPVYQAPPVQQPIAPPNGGYEIPMAPQFRGLNTWGRR